MLQVVDLALEHKVTAICTARLPCTSVAALHSLPGPAAAEKEFLLVASQTDSQQCHSGRPEEMRGLQQGFLSVFEVSLVQQSKHNSSRSGLVLTAFSMHGTHISHAPHNLVYTDAGCLTCLTSLSG